MLIQQLLYLICSMAQFSYHFFQRDYLKLSVPRLDTLEASRSKHTNVNGIDTLSANHQLGACVPFVYYKPTITFGLFNYSANR